MRFFEPEDYEDLPKDPAARWLALYVRAKKRLGDTPSKSTVDDYISAMYVITGELGFGGFITKTRNRHSLDSEGNIAFEKAMALLETRLRLRTTGNSSALSIGLERSTKKHIYLQIESLRQLVAHSDLSKNHKKRLDGKLDELQILINAPRTDFVKVMTVLAVIGASVTSTLADAPAALGTIMVLIGADKQAEEDEQKLLEQEKGPLNITDQSSSSDSDEETPV